MFLARARIRERAVTTTASVDGRAKTARISGFSVSVSWGTSRCLLSYIVTARSPWSEWLASAVLSLMLRSWGAGAGESGSCGTSQSA